MGVDGIFLEVHENPGESPFGRNQCSAARGIARACWENSNRLPRWSAAGACSESRYRRGAFCASKPKRSASCLQRLDASFEQAVDLLLACKGRVVVTGMGKSGLIGRKIAATFSSTGTPSVFLHPAEAVHGDLGMLMRDDVVLAVSYGGETEEIIALLETIKRLGLRMITLTGHPRSTIAAASDVVLDVSVKEEACSLNLAPTASTTAAMAMGDALAVALLDRRGFSPGDFAALHPGGRLGKKLLRVENLMHSGEAMPRVARDRENAGRHLRNEQERAWA